MSHLEIIVEKASFQIFYIYVLVRNMDSLKNSRGLKIVNLWFFQEYINIQQQEAVKNHNGAFVTGLNVFSPEEQAKLDKRAQRFGIEASEAKVLTEKLLKKLYKRYVGYIYCVS